MEKAFGKQTKTIENPQEKQVEGIGEHGKQLIKSSSKKEYNIPKTKRFFDNFLMKGWMKFGQIMIIYYFKSKDFGPRNFIGLNFYQYFIKIY